MGTDALGMLLGTLALILTLGLFITKEFMLGFPSAIFWFVFGGFNYNESAATWDIHYFVFFGSMFMGIFIMFAAFALRGRKEDETLGQEYIDEGEDELAFIDEGKQEKTELDETSKKPSQRVRAVRNRAASRRHESSGFGEFS